MGHCSAGYGGKKLLLNFSHCLHCYNQCLKDQSAAYDNITITLTSWSISTPHSMVTETYRSRGATQNVASGTSVEGCVLRGS